MTDIRKIFLDYFKNTGHRVVPSSSLVPHDDPTLMFVNSGMVQFKNIFLGLEKRDYQTATTAQKCVRAGGKHNDLDNVGYTARHHSFFEMLGNFSFGDYFKEQAIHHAWQVVSQELKLPRDKLCVTVYHDDESAYNLWKKIAGLPDDKIIRIATNDNFWQMGDTGPCGPCSEIFYDHGDKIFGGPPGSKDQDGDRFVEIWNLVFMQYEMQAAGKRIDLPRPSIDTGMGLERITAVLEGVANNYDTSLFTPLIAAVEAALRQKPTEKTIASFRVIADHLRAMAFLVADGVAPSNEGRGYVLRRIMRRAMRHAHMLGNDRPLFGRLLPSLIDVMGGHYNELSKEQKNINQVFLREEEQFEELLARGMGLLNKEIEKIPAGKDLPGAVAFQLYDTFGFPLDLTIDIMRGDGRGVEVAGFDKAMAEQKKRGKESWAGSGDNKQAPIWFALKEKHGETKFLGYDGLSGDGAVIALLDNELQSMAQLPAGDDCWLVLDQTPFYGEAGGQKGDRGTLDINGVQYQVKDTKKYQGIIVHHITATENRGAVKIGDKVSARVDEAWRNGVRANHSATHLLHEALRQELGSHVAQKGSLVANDHLRFDFSHHEAIDAARLAQIESAVNDRVARGGRVITKTMDKPTAEQLGAIALFGEKYGDAVRVVFMGAATDKSANNERQHFYSIELCGGTHVADVAEIEHLMIEREESVASGVRRVTAITGKAMVHKKLEIEINAWQAKIKAANKASVFPPVPTEIIEKQAMIKTLQQQYDAVMANNKKLAKELADKKIAAASNLSLADGEKHPSHDFIYVGKKIDGVTGRDLKPIIDNIKKNPDLANSVIALLAVDDGKVAVAIAVNGTARQAISAGDIATMAGKMLGGSGGGRPDFAMAGGSLPSTERAGGSLPATEMAGGSNITVADDTMAAIKKLVLA
ncbi:MAG: alanine--tRNA ligase [Hydrotalea sp.]|nr:alanine--tRNA ligase [Hydrotalea sp.]